MLCVEGDGFTLSFEGADGPLTRTPWKRAVVTGQAGMSFHQNFAGPQTTRIVSIELGSTASPLFRSRRAAYGDTKVYASGAATIARADERADVRAARGEP